MLEIFEHNEDLPLSERDRDPNTNYPYLCDGLLDLKSEQTLDGEDVVYTLTLVLRCTLTGSSTQIIIEDTDDKTFYLCDGIVIYHEKP